MLLFLEKLSTTIANLTSIAARLMLASVAVVLFVQVVLRFGFNFSLPWPEEASRFLMIWVVMLGGSLLVRDEQLVCVDFFDAFWPRRWLGYRNAFFRLLLAGLLAVLLVKGFDSAIFGLRRTSAALNLSWFWIYLAVPVGAALMLFHMVVLALRDIIRGPDEEQEASLLRAEL
ncbi:TRAP transporter small permease [Thalassospira lucentensis]|uniref:TRAP transporter small permease n=1 Tax=Thalassospira lucentensis TaxID=168935 RepID=UPI00399D64B4|tara:strand:+ start:4518 stop:5036 length:519 start_codon:yes stop_codon:yes gene_type:complete